MADTHVFAVLSEKSTPRPAAYRDDPFTIHDGHYIGHDGFVVPNSFAEFYRRFPAYVSRWVRRRTHGCPSEVEAEEWAQELLLYLAALPPESAYRRNGKQDVIQTFAPERMHGANEARFRSFINRCLSDRFNTLYMKWRKQPLSNPGNLPFEADAEHGASDEFCHSHSEYLRQAGCRSREREEQRFRVEEFVCRASPHVPGLRGVIEVFRNTGNWAETAEAFGRSRCAAIRWWTRREGVTLDKKLGQNLGKELR